MRFLERLTEISKGRKMMERGIFDEAIKHFSRAIAIKRDIDTCCLLAEAYYNKGDIFAVKTILRDIVGMGVEKKAIQRILQLTGTKRIVSDEYINAFPSFSHDGKKIVFSSVRRDTNGDGVIDRKDNFGIYIINEDGTEEKIVVTDLYQNTYPSFSPDGTKIVYLSRRRDTNDDGTIDLLDNPGIYITDLVTGEEKCVVPDIYYNKFPSFSPDGKTILFVSWRGSNSGIYTVDVNGKNERQIVSDKYDNTFPSFSPDGKKIVYASWRRDSNGDGQIDFRDNSGIYIVDVEGKNEEQIVSDRYNNSFPVFSPDGKEIVYLSRRRDTNNDGKIDALDNSGIYLCDIESKKEKCVVSDRTYNKFPSFSPDGQRILFLSTSGNAQKPGQEFFSWKGIYVIDRSGKHKREVISGKYQGNTNPAFSPLGTKILYLAWRKGTKRGLYIADVDSLPELRELENLIEKNL